MAVVCKFVRCGYYQNGFCASPTIAINEAGMCSHLYKVKSNGTIVERPGAFEAVDDMFKRKVSIIDAEWKEDVYGE